MCVTRPGPLQQGFFCRRSQLSRAAPLVSFSIKPALLRLAMASVGNAFDLLRSGETPAASKNKKKKNKSKQKTTADEGAPAVTTETVSETATRSEEVVELADAVPILEKSARTQGPNRIKLWKDWQRQVPCRASSGRSRMFLLCVLVGCMLMSHLSSCRLQTGAPRHSSTGPRMAALFSSGR